MSLEDIKIKVNVSSELVDGNLHIMTSVGETLVHEVILLKEQAVKDALILLGWTPPKEET